MQRAVDLLRDVVLNSPTALVQGTVDGASLRVGGRVTQFFPGLDVVLSTDLHDVSNSCFWNSCVLKQPRVQIHPASKPVPQHHVDDATVKHPGPCEGARRPQRPTIQLQRKWDRRLAARLEERRERRHRRPARQLHRQGGRPLDGLHDELHHSGAHLAHPPADHPTHVKGPLEAGGTVGKLVPRRPTRSDGRPPLPSAAQQVQETHVGGLSERGLRTEGARRGGRGGERRRVPR